MLNKSFLCVLALSFFSAFGFGQTVGDIAFLQYNADGSGTTVKFVALVDIPAGATINFTDYGWLSGGGFRVNAGEGVDTWTSPGAGTPCGTVVSFIETNMILGTGGDQIIAFTGTVGTPTPIAAIQMNGGWDANATSNATSAIPTGLTLGITCIAIAPERDNAMYDSTVNLSDTRANLLTAINNPANWITSNSVVQNFIPTLFTVTDCSGSSCPLSDYTITPTTGAIGTVITVTGPDLGATTTATIDGIAATVTVISPTVLEIIVPAGATTSNLLITNEVACVITQPYTILSTDNSSCDSSITIPAGWGDLHITGVFDNTGGSCHYIELFNPTATPILLTGVYQLGISNNFATANTLPFTFNAGLQALTGTVPAFSTFMVRFGNAGNTCNDCPTIIPDQTIEAPSFGVNGISSGPGVDRILLVRSGTNVDLWGNSDYGPPGYVYTRNTAGTTAPNMTYSAADWTNSGTPDCFGFSIGGTAPLPVITAQPVVPVSCSTTISISVTATEGTVGGNPLAYQWYFSAPGDAGYTALANGGIYSGVTTATLNISDTTGVADYQYYCQVREDDATCYVTSDSVILDITTVSTTWNGTTWDNGLPDATKLVVIAGNYTTGGTTPSFDACSLTINSGFTLDITAGNYANIVNDLTVNGALEIRHEGSLVQQNDLGLVAGTGTTNVYKTTPLYVEYDYTYWSSPVQNETIASVLAGSNINYIFDANTATFNDNDDDSFDDEGDDWVATTGFAPGKGLIAMGQGAFTTPLTLLPYPTYTQSVVFSDAVNNGVVTINVAQDNSATDNSENQNLLGNPYPSAIDPALFISANAGLEGTLYFWTHRTFISDALPGPDAYNFTSDDYNSYNLSGMVASGAGAATPVGYKIASGQGFFASVTNPAIDVIFNNSMRVTTENNNFYRGQPIEKDRIWLNLTTEGNVFRQLLVAFFDNTTQGYDQRYDGRRLENGNNYDFYSLINEDKYVIQARETFDDAIKIPLGIEVTQEGDLTISIATLEGVLNTNDVYIEDKELDIIHNLKDSNYTFNASNAGVFNDRFVLLFNNSALSIDDEVIDDDKLIIYEQENNIINIRSSKNTIITSVKMYDMLGRLLVDKKSNTSTVGIASSRYKSGTIIIVKVLLENNELLVSKLIKK